MKKTFVLAIFSLFVFAFAASAQDKTVDYSGTWTLDVSKSKLDERARIESMTLTVAQTAKDISVATTAKRTPPPAGATGGQGGGRGMGRGGGFGGGDTTSVYTLDAKETTVEQDSPMGKVPVKLTAKIDGGKLSLSSSRTFSTPNGEVSTSNKETWSLSADGKTLTVDQERTTPRGANSSTMVFNKK